MAETSINGEVVLEDEETGDKLTLHVAEAITSHVKDNKEITIARLTNEDYFIGVKGFDGNTIAHCIPKEAFATMLATMVLFAKADKSSEEFFELHLKNFDGYDLTENMRTALGDLQQG